MIKHLRLDKSEEDKAATVPSKTLSAHNFVGTEEEKANLLRKRKRLMAGAVQTTTLA